MHIGHSLPGIESNPNERSKSIRNSYKSTLFPSNMKYTIVAVEHNALSHVTSMNLVRKNSSPQILFGKQGIRYVTNAVEVFKSGNSHFQHHSISTFKQSEIFFNSVIFS